MLKKLLVGLGFRIQDSGFSPDEKIFTTRDEIGFLPYTPHPTPHILHPTSYTPHPTPQSAIAP
ncbi:MAG: hypothetical protein EWV49_01820 [Microcystis aeruginosa Ma_QC_Ch_20071001_S25]|uniref:Uncharacterized protein n=1 Tax=Microcystis aeruginosa Ma_QC_Ch_20071001_S25D TaxID=2486250 RepID=A0A552FL14_MICAE|nr:MAG: hypothetical protein EWV57_16570 [Microcystis aeruginosa Ma_QC_Ch_20071001_S25D]TRU54300.1 MAG: hypothetical protein EWV49_01820 [Microcystis aeruginosa Ma_QC_Ch_20071001_S25]TRU55463.1 MAG: hypothetical protein EWV90_24660 [Microcystis aeruginosa Ma_QC_Ch_20071001_M135]